MLISDDWAWYIYQRPGLSCHATPLKLIGICHLEVSTHDDCPHRAEHYMNQGHMMTDPLKVTNSGFRFFERLPYEIRRLRWWPRTRPLMADFEQSNLATILYSTSNTSSQHRCQASIHYQCDSRHLQRSKGGGRCPWLWRIFMSPTTKRK